MPRESDRVSDRVWRVPKPTSAVCRTAQRFGRNRGGDGVELGMAHWRRRVDGQAGIAARQRDCEGGDPAHGGSPVRKPSLAPLPQPCSTLRLLQRAQLEPGLDGGDRGLGGTARGRRDVFVGERADLAHHRQVV